MSSEYPDIFVRQATFQITRPYRSYQRLIPYESGISTGPAMVPPLVVNVLILPLPAEVRAPNATPARPVGTATVPQPSPQLVTGWKTGGKSWLMKARYSWPVLVVLEAAQLSV